VKNCKSVNDLLISSIYGIDLKKKRGEKGKRIAIDLRRKR
jgi:hypothetical protein